MAFFIFMNRKNFMVSWVIKKIHKPWGHYYAEDIMTFYTKTQDSGSSSEVINIFSYSTQLSTKFILLINVNKMPTIVGILTFIGMINTTSETLKATLLVFLILVSMSSCHFVLSWVEHENFYNLRPDVSSFTW